MTQRSAHHPPRPAPLEGYEPWGPATQKQLVRLLRFFYRHHGLPQLVGVALVLALGTSALLHLFLADTLTTASYVALLFALVPAWMVVLYLTLPHLSVALTRRRERDAWVVGYFSEEASQLIYPRDGRWMIGDHFARPGHGRALRRDVIPHLARQADAHGIHVELETSSLKLARMYQQEVPELSDPRRRGWRLGRPVYVQRRAAQAGPRRPTND